MAEWVTVGNVIAVANRVTAGDVGAGAMTIEVSVEVVDGTGAG